MKVAVIGGGEHLVGKALLDSCQTSVGPIVPTSRVLNLEEASQAIDVYKPYLDEAYKLIRLIPKEKEHKCKGGRHQYRETLIRQSGGGTLSQWACSCGAKL